MSDRFDLHVTPEPAGDDRDAILAAVRQTLDREADLARPSGWRLHGWIEQRVGLTDLARWVPDHRRWALSTRMPLRGPGLPRLQGRGDAK